MERRKRVQSPQSSESKTQQHFKDSSDITKIMTRARETGMLPVRPNYQKARFMSLTGQTWHEMLMRVDEVKAEFARLPAATRRKFNNNPELLIKHAENGANWPELVRLGVFKEEDLPDAMRQQQDLVRQSEQKDWKEFKSWQAARRRGLPQGKNRASSQAGDSGAEGTTT